MSSEPDSTGFLYLDECEERGPHSSVASLKAVFEASWAAMTEDFIARCFSAFGQAPSPVCHRLWRWRLQKMKYSEIWKSLLKCHIKFSLTSSRTKVGKRTYFAQWHWRTQYFHIPITFWRKGLALSHALCSICHTHIERVPSKSASDTWVKGIRHPPEMNPPELRFLSESDPKFPKAKKQKLRRRILTTNTWQASAAWYCTTRVHNPCYPATWRKQTSRWSLQRRSRPTSIKKSLSL